MFLFTLPHFINVLLLTVICQQTSDIGNRTPLLVHSIKYDLQNNDHHTVMDHFMDQISYQKIIFSAGFFVVDHTLLFTVI